MRPTTAEAVIEMTGPTNVWPALRYANARATIVFLVEAFGFQEKAVYGEGDRVDHAELVWPGGRNAGFHIVEGRVTVLPGHRDRIPR